MKMQELYNPNRDREGSGNIGATNVGEYKGPRLIGLVFVLPENAVFV